MTGVRPSALAGTDEQAALADAVSGFAERAGLTQQARAALDQDLDRLPVGWPSLADQELLALPWDAQVFETCVALEVLRLQDRKVLLAVPQGWPPMVTVSGTPTGELLTVIRRF